MTRFLLKVFLFLLPVGLVFAFPAAVFLLAREGYLIETAVRAQTSHPDIIIGRAYTDTDNTGIFYKTELVREKNPEIITMGSSRTMEFRREFFAQPEAFVGASFSAAYAEQFEDFIRDLPPRVSVIVLGLDHRIFRSDYVPLAPNSAMTMGKILSDFFVFDWRWIYYDYVRGRFSFSDLLKRNMNSGNIGLSALIDGNGYRGDGSYSYQKKLTDPARKELLAAEIQYHLDALKSDRSSFEYSAEISLSALEALESALAAAEERDITVLGFLPPYSHSLYVEMLSKDDEYRESVFELPKGLRAIFNRYGFPLYDFSDDTVLGGSKDEYIDPDHPTDKLNLRLLIHMAQREAALRPYVDIKKAQALLQNTPGDFFPFPPLK